MSRPHQERKKTLRLLLVRRFHILQWLPKYKKSDIVADLIAGLTVGLTMIPQSIAYANLAGLPAQYGLYTAFIGSFTYVFFGTIKQVSIGPSNTMALLTFSYTEGLSVEYVILLTFLVGCVEFAMGALNLGFLLDFVSPCVTSGFTSAMSVTLVTSQLKNVLGLRKLKNHGVFDVWTKIFSRFNEIKLADSLLGFSCIVFLFAFKQLPKIRTKNKILKKTLWLLLISRNALVVLITSTVAYYFHAYRNGSPFILSGEVPRGLPQVQLPHFGTRIGNETATFFEMVHSLGTGIIVVPLVAVLANVAIAKAFVSGVIVDATQEMMTLGLCNIFGSFIQAMPCCGAFTRSAVANSSGVRTPLQGIYSGTVILLALSFLTPYFYYIPRSTLGAVLISAVVPLFDYKIFLKLWRYNRFDFFITFVTFSTGVFHGIEIGIIIGALLNLIILLKVWTRPRIIKEIRMDTHGNQYTYVKPEVGLYYSGTDYLMAVITEAYNNTSNLPIIVDCANIVRVDYAACETIGKLIKTFKKVSLLNVKPEIYKIIKNTTDFDDEKMCKNIDNISEGVAHDSEIPLIDKTPVERKL